MYIHFFLFTILVTKREYEAEDIVKAYQNQQAEHAYEQAKESIWKAYPPF
ncbi:YrzI family small protein [Salsuginibacillus kocurii]|nr:YrzI family small protein [Salsuginibacillus kocurii]